MLYVILVVIIALAIFSKFSRGKAKENWYLLASIVLISYSCLRNGFLYPDIANYYDYFRGQYELDSENFGIGYKLINDMCHLLSNSFQFELAVISIIVVYGYTKAIKNFSPYIWLSLILYILVSYYPSFFLLRQYIALSIFMLSLRYIIKREPIKFGICAILAISVHATAVVIVPLYFLYGLKYNLKNMIFLAAGSAATVVLFFSLQGYIELVSAYYAHYFESFNEESAWMRALTKVYIAVVYLLVMRKNFYNEGINRIVFYCMLITVVISIAAVNVFSVHRLREYFSLAEFIGISVMLKEVTRKSAGYKVITYVLLLPYVIIMLITFNSFIMGSNMNNQYAFFWNSTIR